MNNKQSKGARLTDLLSSTMRIYGHSVRILSIASTINNVYLFTLLFILPYTTFMILIEYYKNYRG